MILDKYLLIWEQCLRKMSARLDIPVPNHHQLALLMMLKRRGSMRFAMLKSLCKKYGKQDDPSYLAQSLHKLIRSGLIEKTDFQYTLSAKGREYLFYVINYLRNYRL
jgi:DNA-binding HxlR family transcriptional regulator